LAFNYFPQELAAQTDYLGVCYTSRPGNKSAHALLFKNCASSLKLRELFTRSTAFTLLILPERLHII
jgi:hypothetical protein